MKRFHKLCKISALLLCGILAFGGCGKDGDKGGSGNGKEAASDTEQLMAYKDTRYLPKFTDTSEDYDAFVSVGIGFLEDTFYLIKRELSGYAISGGQLIARNPDTGEEAVLVDNTGRGERLVTAAPLGDGSVMDPAVGSEWQTESRGMSLSAGMKSCLKAIPEIRLNCFVLHWACLIIQARYQYPDRELVEQLKENPYYQHFIGIPGYQERAPIDASTLVLFRKCLTADILREANEYLLEKHEEKQDDGPSAPRRGTGEESNSGTLVLDAVCSPVNIRYPQDENGKDSKEYNSYNIFQEMLHFHLLELSEC